MTREVSPWVILLPILAMYGILADLCISIHIYRSAEWEWRYFPIWWIAKLYAYVSLLLVGWVG